MRYQFIVRDSVPDNIREELPEFSITSFPTGCTAPVCPGGRRVRPSQHGRPP